MQLAWSALVLAEGTLLLIGRLFHGSSITGAAVFIGLAVLYAWLSLRAYRGAWWAWWLGFLVPAYVVIRRVPSTIFNLVAFATDHPLYLDSPATIIIVLIDCAVISGPGLLIFCTQLFTWRDARPPFLVRL